MNASSSLSSILHGPTGAVGQSTGSREDHSRPPSTAGLRRLLTHPGATANTEADHKSPDSQASSSTLRQPALKHQSYLYKLVSDRRQDGAASAPIGHRRWSQQPKPATTKLYKSPFLLPAEDQSASTVRQPAAKTFDYKAFHRTGSWVAASRSGSSGPKSAAVQKNAGPASWKQSAVVTDSVTSDRRRTTGGTLTMSGVKPASHHEPCGHAYVIVSLFCSNHKP